jgi:membrane protease YdiL (CAAX protease family)
MPTIDLAMFDHILFLALVALFPWNARRRFQSLVKAVDGGDTKARMRSYRTVVVEKWLLTAVIFVAWITLSRSASSIGLIPSVTLLAIAGYALTATAIGALVMLARAAVHSEQGRRRTSESIASVRSFVPRTATEKRWFDAMSVTAGIEEELVYRGFLFAYFAAWLPSMPAAAIILLAGLVFGLGHLYQGAAGVVKTGTLGVLFGVVYWMTGSLWAPMLLHVVVDLSSGWITRKIVADGGLNELAEPVPA